MSTLRDSVLAAAAACLLGFMGQAQAQTNHTISVDVDEATGGDIQLIEDSLANAAEGSQVSRSLRGIIMSALGEVLPAVNARIDEFDILTLDDGSKVALFEEDSITVETKRLVKKFGPQFACGKKKIIVSGRGGCQPECVILPTGKVVHIPPGGPISILCPVVKK
jgi:hypothetical protein